MKATCLDVGAFPGSFDFLTLLASLKLIVAA
jgi:hypothetical protein